MGRENGSDGDPLGLAPGQVGEAAGSQMRQTHEVEHLFHALAHHSRVEAELFHRERQLFLDGVGDEPGGRILGDVTDQIGHLPRRGRRCRARPLRLDLPGALR